MTGPLLLLALALAMVTCGVVLCSDARPDAAHLVAASVCGLLSVGCFAAGCTRRGRDR